VKLYYAEVLNPRKACAVAKYLDSPVDYVRVDLRQGEHLTPSFRAINPNAKIPVLEDGERTIWEADAIMCHLARRAGSELWPHDDRQVDVLRWMSWNHVHFTRHAGQLYFEHVIKPRFGGRPANEAKVAEALKAFPVAAAVLEAHLAERSFLVGDALTLADFAVAGTLPYAAEARLPLDAFPAIRRWHDRLLAVDAWREPFPVVAAAAA